jgi:hypothetical protein
LNDIFLIFYSHLNSAIVAATERVPQKEHLGDQECQQLLHLQQEREERECQAQKWEQHQQRELSQQAPVRRRSGRLELFCDFNDFF